eukprot:Awhi_evm1s10335
MIVIRPLLFGEGDVFNDERWLDYRRLDLFGGIMLDRIDYAKKQGCEAIEFDNPDVITHESKFEDGFGPDLTLVLQFNIWLVRQ